MSEFSKKKELKNKHFVIAIHEAIPVGPGHDLKLFLQEQNVKELLFITHPLTYIKEFYKNSSQNKKYKNGKLTNIENSYHWRLPDVLLYLKDILYTIFWTSKQKQISNVFFGVDPLNAFSGIILRRLGRTNKVVYYSIDYFTKRFKNNLLNKIYHMMDKFCVKYSDETWNLSPMMQKSRERFNNMRGEDYSRQVVVPIGVWFKKVNRKSYKDINKNKIIFIGSFTKMMGIDSIIKAAPLIKRSIPNIVIDIVGGGPEYDNMLRLAKRMKVSTFVNFYGWVSDRKKLDSLMSDAALGLAPFNPNVITDEIKNADPAKIKDYMLWGMPVVMTDAPSSTKELLEAGCVRVISYDERQLAKEVVSLLQDEKRLKKYRDNALNYVSKFDYEVMFKENIFRILKS